MTPRFAIGDPVRVACREQPGHIRTPAYVMGRRGHVKSIAGCHPNPELVARGELGLPYAPLYRVAFNQGDVWENYGGARDDQIIVDLYEHWLESDVGRG